jgi:hypothetical protein
MLFYWDSNHRVISWLEHLQETNAELEEYEKWWLLAGCTTHVRVPGGKYSGACSD